MRKYTNYCTCYGVNKGEELLGKFYTILQNCVGKKEVAVRHERAEFALLLRIEDEASLEQRLRKITFMLNAAVPDQSFHFSTGIYIIDKNEDALIDRQKTGSYYKTKAQNNIDVINAKIKEAYKNPNTFSSAEILHEAVVLAEETDLYLDILSVVNNKMRSIVVPDYKNAQAVAELERQMRAAVAVYIDVNQDENGRIQAAFKAVLKKYGVTTSLDKDTASYTLVVNVSFTTFEMPESPNILFICGCFRKS